MNHDNKHLIEKGDIPAYFTGKHTEVIITMGAGDIDTLVEPIENFFSANKKI